MTYIWCGSDRWCYLFNVTDVFTREWTGYAFDTAATRHNAVMSVNNAIASRKPRTPGLSSVLITARSMSAVISKNQSRYWGQGWSLSITTPLSRMAT